MSAVVSDRVANQRVNLPAGSRILVVALRRLGDVLLTTPLIRSLRSAWPDARIDVLVFEDTAGILSGNQDIDHIVRVPPRPTAAQTISLAARLAWRYDLSISTQTGDRPSTLALIASRRAVAPVERRFSGRVKRALLWRSVSHDRQTNRVDALLKLADVLGIPRASDVVPPKRKLRSDIPKGRYAVVHAAPMFNYKRWTVQGWRSVYNSLVARGITVLASGGSADVERMYLDEVWKGTDAIRFDGKCDWQELSAILSDASVFVGPDTSVTHLAAATGCPTVALFGPTDPRIWGPWPAGGLQDPWAAQKALQRRGNVWIAQHAFPCTPCQLEGCERRLSSESECLKHLTIDKVLTAIDQAIEFAPDHRTTPNKFPFSVSHG